jgi:predicted exporter
MVHKLVEILVILMIILLAWVLYSSTTDVSIIINGKPFTGPLAPAIGLWKLILTSVILFSVAILLAFVFAGVGLVILGCLALVGLILAALALPFLLPLLIPLFIVWAFCALLFRHKKT